MRPAYLADVHLGDRIRFRLPAAHGGSTEHEGVLWAYDPQRHAVGTPTISGDVARLFTCRPDLNIDLEDK
jgi:hypothetical protein